MNLTHKQNVGGDRRNASNKTASQRVFDIISTIIERARTYNAQLITLYRHNANGVPTCLMADGCTKTVLMAWAKGTTYRRLSFLTSVDRTEKSPASVVIDPSAASRVLGMSRLLSSFWRHSIITCGRVVDWVFGCASICGIFLYIN